MGMYTELIFGAGLKKDTPKKVIKNLKLMIEADWEDLQKAPKEIKSFSHIFRISSYYFGVNDPIRKIWFDKISENWRVSTRSNVKNYGSEIEQFLEWIKPFIEQGSGEREFYAIVIYEEDIEPTIYYLEEGKYA